MDYIGLRYWKGPIVEVMFPIAIRSRNGGRLNPPLHHPRISPSQTHSGNQAGHVPGPSLIKPDGLLAAVM